MADKRTLWHKAEGLDWHPVELHATDAVHALEIDPDHWKVAKPAPEPEPDAGTNDDFEEGDE